MKKMATTISNSHGTHDVIINIREKLMRDEKDELIIDKNGLALCNHEVKNFTVYYWPDNKDEATPIMISPKTIRDLFHLMINIEAKTDKVKIEND